MLFRRKEATDINDIKEAMLPEEPMHVQEPRAVSVPTSAPLFVKVDKYREILSGIQEMKIFVSGTRQLFNVLHELETVRSDAINIMRATIQRLEKSIVEIDSELLRPRGVGVSDVVQGNVEAQHLEDSLTELQTQLAGLRKELQEIK